MVTNDWTAGLTQRLVTLTPDNLFSQLLKLELVLLRPAPVSVEAEEAGGRLVHEAAHTGGCHRIVIIQCQAHLHQ